MIFGCIERSVPIAIGLIFLAAGGYMVANASGTGSPAFTLLFASVVLYTGVVAIVGLAFKKWPRFLAISWLVLLVVVLAAAAIVLP